MYQYVPIRMVSFDATSRLWQRLWSCMGYFRALAQLVGRYAPRASLSTSLCSTGPGVQRQDTCADILDFADCGTVKQLTKFSTISTKLTEAILFMLRNGFNLVRQHQAVLVSQLYVNNSSKWGLVNPTTTLITPEFFRTATPEYRTSSIPPT
jgi:hypothetical protein